MKETSNQSDNTHLSSEKQQQLLTLYHDYHDLPPSVGRLIGRNLRRYLLMIVTAVLAMMLLYSLQSPNLAFLVLGLVLGAFLRDVATFRRLTKTWPTTDLVMDWDRVHTLLGDDQD